MEHRGQEPGTVEHGLDQELQTFQAMSGKTPEISDAIASARIQLSQGTLSTEDVRNLLGFLAKTLPPAHSEKDADHLAS